MRWTDEHDGQLLIDSTIEITNRGDGTPELREAATRTANVRTVTLDADTVEMIDKLRRARAPYGPWMCGLGPEPVSPDRIGWWWKRARQLSGIDDQWRLHDLRHWSETMAIGQGHDVRTVAGRLGHANPAMTLRVYAHAFAAADQAVAAGLGESLKGDGKCAEDSAPLTRSSTSRSAASALSWCACWSRLGVSRRFVARLHHLSVRGSDFTSTKRAGQHAPDRSRADRDDAGPRDGRGVRPTPRRERVPRPGCMSCRDRPPAPGPFGAAADGHERWQV